MQNKAAARTNVGLRVVQKPRLSTPKGSARLFRNSSTVWSATEDVVAPVKTKDESDGVNTSQHYTGKKALVVGAGPAGSVAAAFLAKQGFDVQVHEKRDDPTRAGAKVERPIPMLLTQATANVVRAINIEVPSTYDEYRNGLRRRRGMIIVSKKGPLVKPPPYREERLAATRSDLAKSIMANVRDKNPEKITFHFEHSCIDIDLTKQQVQFRDQDNNIVKQEYDLLVGADGANSEVRKAMEKEMEDFRVSTTTNSGSYKAFAGLPVVEEAVPEEYRMMLQARHSSLYPLDGQTESDSGLQSIYFCRIAGDDLAGIITGTPSGFESVKGREKEYLSEVTPEWFPQEWIDRLAAQLKDSPVYRCPSITEVSSLVGPGVVLIGDAGHSVSTVLGQGCNMAVQDGQFLDDALESAKGDISLALKEFNQSRFKGVRQTQALELFASAAYLESKGIVQLLPILAKMHTVLHAIGNKYLPWLVPKPVLVRYRLNEVSIDEAIRILKVELAALLVMAAAVSFVSVSAIMNPF